METFDHEIPNYFLFLLFFSLFANKYNNIH